MFLVSTRKLPSVYRVSSPKSLVCSWMFRVDSWKVTEGRRIRYGGSGLYYVFSVVTGETGKVVICFVYKQWCLYSWDKLLLAFGRSSGSTTTCNMTRTNRCDSGDWILNCG